jgi:hypothetical protein
MRTQSRSSCCGGRCLMVRQGLDDLEVGRLADTSEREAVANGAKSRSGNGRVYQSDSTPSGDQLI